MKISFNKNFYSKNVIEKALEDFKEFIISSNQNGLDVEIDCADNIFDEFCNYVLGLLLNDREL